MNTNKDNHAFQQVGDIARSMEETTPFLSEYRKYLQNKENNDTTKNT